VADSNYQGSAAGTLVIDNPGPLQILTQPTSTTVVAGQTATFSVAVNSFLPVSYQWRKVNTNIPGATSATLVIANVQPADAANYRVVVSTTAGSLTSNWATLGVLVPPMITQQPRDALTGAGKNVSFTVAATGTAPLTYQWQKNGALLPGETSARLQLQKVTAAHAGVYTVLVSNPGGSTTSNPATLTVQ
jgi:hypothetical protein